MGIEITGAMIVNLVLGVAGTFIGIWLKRLDNDFADLKTDIKEIKRDYQTKEMANADAKHADAILSEIRDQLKNINQKLDNKADK